MTQTKNSTYVLRCGVEFVSGPITGVFIGHGIDRFCNSHPWGLVVFIVLGTFAGFLNLYRLITKGQTSLKKPKD